jgi:uncharacterized protein YndB with AHSA1/START domain
MTSNNLEIIVEPGRQDIVMTRVFDAPRDVVYRVITDPTLIPTWWGPKGLTTTVERMEVQPGGRWRFVQHDAEGNEFAFRGVYHDAVAPERFTSTFEWEGLPGHVALDTVTLEEVDGKTRYTTVSVFQSLADRDGMVQSGMEGGARESMDRLAEAIAGLLSRA